MKYIVRISAAVLVLGLVSSVGYFKYCSGASGKQILKEKILTVDLDRMQMGSVGHRRVRGTSETNSLSVQLSPEMNPFSINITGKYLPAQHSSSRKEAPYRAELSSPQTSVWEKEFTIADSQKRRMDDTKGIKVGKMELPSFHFHVHTFSVREAGLYTLTISPTQQVPDLLVTDLSVEIRRNVLEANRTVVTAGAVLAILGLIGVVIPSAIANKQRK